MVSFQCDACQDVVKKPKLDVHFHNRCHGTFTCVDCSRTFRTPAEWKGHTSCISEAEKYQKGLYTGKKSNPNGSTDPRGGKPQNSRDGVTSNPNGAEPEQAAETKLPKKSDEPTQDHTQPNKVAFTASQDNPAKGDLKEKKKKKKRKIDKARGEVAIANDDTETEKKKRKLDASDNNVGTTKVSGAAESQTKREDVVPVSTELEKLDAETEKKEKKKRKSKNSIKEGEMSEAGASPATDSQPSADSNKLPEKKHKKKSKKGASEEGSAGFIAAATDDAIDEAVAKKKKKKERKEKSAEKDKLKEEHATNAGKEGAALENGKLYKKRKRPEIEGGGDDEAGDSKKAKKEKKKDKKEKRKVDAERQKADKSS